MKAPSTDWTLWTRWSRWTRWTRWNWCAVALIGVGIALFMLHDPVATIQTWPGPIELPERMDSAAPATMDVDRLGIVLLAAAALLALAWRRSVGASPASGLLVALMIELHPGMLAAVTHPEGVTDLAALCVLLLGACLQAEARRTSWCVGIGLGLLLLAALAAPSGATFAILAAFVLLERRPAMQRGALLVVLYGALRGSIAPAGFLAFSRLPGFATSSAPTSPTDWWNSLLGSAASVVPVSLPLVAPAPIPAPGGEQFAVACAFLAVLVLGATVLAPGRRFGGRWSALLAVACVALVALMARHGMTAPPTAVLPAVILLGIWIGGLAQRTSDAEGGPRIGAIQATVAVAARVTGAVVVVGLATVVLHNRDRFESTHTLFAAKAAGGEDIHVASFGAASFSGHPVEVAACRVRLKACLGDADGTRAIQSIQAGAAGLSDVCQRDVALAASLAGLHQLAVMELARDLAGDDWPRILDLLDVRLRGSDALGVLRDLDEIEQRTPGVGSGAMRAQLLLRRGSAEVILALDSDAAGASGPDAQHLDRALQAFDRAVEQDSSCAEVLLSRGRLRMARLNAVGAVKDFEAAARLRPDSAAPRLELAKLYFSRGQDEAGERELAVAQRLEGRQTPEVALVTAQLLLARGDLAGAAQLARALPADTYRLRGGARELAQLFRSIARAAEDAGATTMAMEAARESEELSRDRTGETVMRLARLYRQERDFEGELRMLKDAQERALPIDDLDDLIAASLKNGGYAYFLAGQAELARSRFLELFDRADDLAGLGAVAEILRNLDEKNGFADREQLVAFAREAYEQGARDFLASNPRRAEALLRTSVALLPENAYAYYQLGLTLDLLGRPDEAEDAFRHAVRLGEAMNLQEIVAKARGRLSGGP